MNVFGWLGSAFILLSVTGCVFTPSDTAVKPSTLIADGVPLPESADLTEARKNLVFALRELRDGFDLGSFSEYNGCHANDPNLCAYALEATSAQKDFLRDFLSKSISPILKLNTQSPVTTLLLFNKPVMVTNPAGQNVPANSWTTLDPMGPINFYSGAVEHISSHALMAMLGHEFGHKFSFDGSGRPIQDNDVIGPFNSPTGGGRFALDAFGAFLACYYADHSGKVPVLFPDLNRACEPENILAQLAQAPVFFGDSSGSSVSQGQPSVDAGRVFKSIDTGSFTVEAWVKIDSDAASDLSDSSTRYIFSSLDSADRFIGGLEIMRMTNGNIGAYVGTEQVYDSGILLEAGNFHQVVVRKDGTTIQFFVDGVAGQSYANVDGTIQSFVTPQVGTRANPSSNTWKGQIARLAIYTQPLSQDEIANLYSCGTH